MVVPVAPRFKKIDGRLYSFLEGFAVKTEARHRADSVREVRRRSTRVIKIPGIRGYFVYVAEGKT